MKVFDVIGKLLMMRGCNYLLGVISDSQNYAGLIFSRLFLTLFSFQGNALSTGKCPGCA